MTDRLRFFILVAFILSTPQPCIIRAADFAVDQPRIAQKFIAKPGSQVPLDLVFRNEKDEPVQLGTLLQQKPAILSLVYFDCPMMCTQILNGLISSLRRLPLYDFSQGSYATWGLGGSIAVSLLPAALTPFYGSNPLSYTIFTRLKFSTGTETRERGRPQPQAPPPQFHLAV